MNLALVVDALVASALPYIALDRAAELSRNMAAVLTFDAAATPEAVALELILHRIKHFNLECGDARSTAVVMGLAWRRFVGRYGSIEEAA